MDWTRGSSVDALAARVERATLGHDHGVVGRRACAEEGAARLYQLHRPGVGGARQ